MHISSGLKTVSGATRHPRAVQGYSLAQGGSRLGRHIEGRENHVAVLGREHRALMICNRDTSAIQRRAGHESSLVHAQQGRCPLNLRFDTRLGALLHPRRLWFFDGGRTVLLPDIGSLLSRALV